jgi:hypothetical protein
MAQVSREHSSISPRKVRPLLGFDAVDYQELSRIGINITPRDVGRMVDGIGMDALPTSQLTASIATPIQFLQQWLPGFVQIMTAARRIDDLIGISTIGAWEDEEIVQGVMERLGFSVPYGDLTNVPLANWNVNFNTRNVVRFEAGMRVTVLEEARASRIKISTATEKRNSATLSLEIGRNAVGFFGYNSGANNTYGFLNDPGLGTYTVFANGASTYPQWSTKTFLEITADIRTMISALRVQSQDNLDPRTVPLTMALATQTVDWLSITNVQGTQSVTEWLKQTYPNIRVISAPELAVAHAGDNVVYLYAESVGGIDGSTDDGRVFLQVVPAKFKVVGVQTLAKGYEEDYSNSTAGVMVKRPWAIVRYFGN